MIKINKIAIAILKALNNQVEYVSGTRLSEQLNVSRNAIWKQVSKLREKGYEIEARPRYGYKLINTPMTLDSTGLAASLKTQLIGTNIVTVAKTTSTNDLAKNYAKNGAEEGLVVIATKQTQGRGRRGRQWHSNENGLYCSILLRPRISLDQAAKITLLTGVAVVETLQEHYSVNAILKWPNDVLVNGKKICGILTELSADPEMINYLVIGIGLNTNQKSNLWPKEIAEIATSISIETKQKIKTQNILQQLLAKLEQHYLDFIANDNYDLISLAKQYSALIGKEITVTPNNQAKYNAKAINLDESGALIVEKSDGTIVSLWAADVSVRTNKKRR